MYIFISLLFFIYQSLFHLFLILFSMIYLLFIFGQYTRAERRAESLARSGDTRYTGQWRGNTRHGHGALVVAAAMWVLPAGAGGTSGVACGMRTTTAEHPSNEWYELLFIRSDRCVINKFESICFRKRSKTSNKIKQFKFLSCILYNFHNSYFVNFIYFCIFPIHSFICICICWLILYYVFIFCRVRWTRRLDETAKQACQTRGT